MEMAHRNGEINGSAVKPQASSLNRISEMPKP